MSKLISFSVWGNSNKYLNGCVENISLAKTVYPGWVVRFYCDSEVDQSFISTIKGMGAEVFIMKTLKNNWEGLFWRFFPASESDVEVFISRDIDSRLNVREKAAVDEWLKSDKDLHVMRDHIEHNVPILGGMWGCRNSVLNNIKELIDSWGEYTYKGSDQDFLRKVIWPAYREKVIAHDKYYNNLSIEQIVTDVEDYHKQRKAYSDKRELAIQDKERYIRDNKNSEFYSISDQEVNRLFPEIPELSPIRTNDKGQIIYDYVYDPNKFFGEHLVLPFPPHGKMSHGVHVGEIIE